MTSPTDDWLARLAAAVEQRDRRRQHECDQRAEFARRRTAGKNTRNATRPSQRRRQ